MNPIPRVNVLGCGISAINLQVAETAVLEAVRERRKGYVTVTGVHGVSEAHDVEPLDGHPFAIVQ